MAARPDLTVQVRDAAANGPVDGVVVLDPGGRDAELDGGEAVFERVLAGDYTVTVVATGYGRSATEVTIDDADADASLTISANGVETVLWGRVRGPDGAALAGATVSVDDVALATTDTGGAYILEDLAGGTLSLHVAAPEGTDLNGYTVRDFTLTEGTRAEAHITLAGGTDGRDDFEGSAICAYCHEEIVATWQTSAHGQSARSPADLTSGAVASIDGLAAAFEGGDALTLSNGATVSLSIAEAGAWYVQVTDTQGDATSLLPVEEVYGGNQAAAALALEVSGTLVVAPVAWALAERGAGDGEPVGLVEAWTDGWFDEDGALDLDGDDRPAPSASWDLQCAGCHATGHGLGEDGDAWSLAEIRGDYERTVGCEACHGPGESHFKASSAERKLTIVQPQLLAPRERLDVCARCHSRTSSADHPFSEAPAWPVDAQGDSIGVGDLLSDFATPTGDRWEGLDLARDHREQATDFEASPHWTGGWQGACEHCHDPHGSEHTASLRADPNDNSLCTTCHGTAFPDEAAEQDHAGHDSFDPGRWTPGSCTSCHLGRSATVVQPDPRSGAGEVRSHTLTPWSPAEALASFDAAGSDTLEAGQVPVPACLDCHLQAEATTGCDCPLGDPTARSTYEDLQEAWDDFVGGGE